MVVHLSQHPLLPLHLQKSPCRLGFSIPHHVGVAAEKYPVLRRMAEVHLEVELVPPRGAVQVERREVRGFSHRRRCCCIHRQRRRLTGPELVLELLSPSGSGLGLIPWPRRPSHFFWRACEPSCSRLSGEWGS